MSDDQDLRRILLVEDEAHLAFNLEFNLTAEGYDVVVAMDGKQAMEAYRQKGPFTLILLDVMLPAMNGFEVAEAIRAEDQRTQILMLTARAAETDVIQGLETGVDDYLTKPFSFKELLLRINRMAARSKLFTKNDAARQDMVQTFGDMKWHPHRLELTSPHATAVLTALEAKVLQEFLNHPDTVLSRKHLLNQVWGVTGNVETRTVDNFIMRLRRYLEDNPAKPRYLKSVRGRGYKFCGPVHTRKEEDSETQL
jgi:DNA-binding response OmpR family regulator